VSAAFIIGNANTSKIVKQFLVQLKIKFELTNPIITIDQDLVEGGSLDKLQWNFLLCEFHVVKTQNKKLRTVKQPGTVYTYIKRIQRSKSPKELAIEVRRFQIFCNEEDMNDFYTYFAENWLCQLWALGWIDAFRNNAPREGLGNTNNFSEASIRSMQMHLGYMRGGIGWLVKQLILNTIPKMANKVEFQGTKGWKKTKKSRSLLAVERRYEEARQIVPEAIKEITEITYEITGSNSETYLIRLDENSCTCLYYLRTGKYCKHVMRALLEKSNGDWDSKKNLFHLDFRLEIYNDRIKAYEEYKKELSNLKDTPKAELPKGRFEGTLNWSYEPDAFMDLDIAENIEDETVETESTDQPTNSPKKRGGSLNLLNKPNFLGSAKPGRQKKAKTPRISSLSASTNFML
jgi:hypothetical protein